MITKTFRGGRTYRGALATIKYLLDERVSQGTAKLIRGDIEDTKALIKIASKNKWSWSSGVLSFQESELDNKSIKEIMNLFEKTFFPGFDKTEYDISWIQHKDKGRVELHYIAPRLELRTNKAYNPYFVKRDFNKKDLFQKYINAQYNLSSPSDNPQLTKQNRKEWAKDKKSLLAQIDDIVIEYINDGLIESRDDIVYMLRNLNLEVSGLEEGHKYLTITTKENKKIRLKGLIYGQDFNYTREKSTGAERDNTQRSKSEDRQNAQRFKSELDAIISRQAKYNSDRYKSKSTAEHRADESRQQKVKQSSSENTERATTQNQDNSSPHRPHNRYNNRKLDNVSDDESVADDRVREEIDRKLRQLRARIRRVREEQQRIREQQQDINSRNKNNGEKMEELNKFKTDINLAEYMSSFGYKRDVSKSSLNFTVMVNDSDKLIVSRSRENGHYIYFNSHNDDDGGSIIDFIQNRFKESLGAVRKRLRKWISNPQPQDNINISLSDKDTNKIIKFWDNLRGEDFTEPYRGISIDNLNFKDAYSSSRIKKVGNKIYFMLSNKDGVCGIEHRSINSDRKGIIKDSIKGLWVNGYVKNVKRIIIAESPIDALSYKELHSKEADLYVGIQGDIGDSAKESLKAIFEYYKEAQIVIAVDKDDGGDRLSRTISDLILDVDKSLERGSRVKPISKDWNDDLVAKQELEKSIEHSEAPVEKAKVSKERPTQNENNISQNRRM